VFFNDLLNEDREKKLTVGGKQWVAYSTRTTLI